MPSTRTLKTGAWTLVLAVSLVLYHSERALQHFLWHLVYGGSFGLLAGALASYVREVPARHPSLWFGAGYVYMIVPDLIWIAPRLGGEGVHPHQAWMDVFLGHVFLDAWAWSNALMAPALVVAVSAFWLAREG